MKARTILGLLSFLLGFGCLTTSCDDMLTPELKRYSENFSGKDTINFYLGIIGDLQQVVGQNYLLGDLRSDIASPTEYTNDSVANIMNFNRQLDGENGLLNRAAYYKVINQCNFYLNRVDTLASKNGNFYMRREAAQVLLIRAWTYMQLVQNYGKVPFILAPVDNANTGWEKNPQAWATTDNLFDLLYKDVERALAYELAYGAPNYGSFNMGNKSISHREMIFHARLVLADLYLMRGNNKSDYVNAAKFYYQYLQEETSEPNVTASSAAKYGKESRGNNEIYTPEAMSWLFKAQSSGYITSIPSAANSSFGTVITRIPETYGYGVSSRNRTSTNKDEEGKDQVSNSASINLQFNYKMRQVAVSPRLMQMYKNEVYVMPDYNGRNLMSVNYITQGDARATGNYREIPNTDGEGKDNFITKVVDGFIGFQNKIALYRHRQVLLRYAEALNRAGYPRFAFAVLHGGLVGNKIPTLRDSLQYDDVNKTVQKVFYIDSVRVGNNFINANELRRAQADPNQSTMLDFKSAKWIDNSSNLEQNPTFVGIRDLGCGFQIPQDTINTYEKLVTQRIQQEAARRGVTNSTAVAKAIRQIKHVALKLEEANEGEAVDSMELAERRKTYTVLESAPIEAPNPLEVDAVESLIADQTAMENGYEGFRYYDLMRIARHKNLDESGMFAPTNGTQWFAWQIARRDVDLPIYAQPEIYNATIYNLLLNQENWYLKNPLYK